MKRIRWLTIAFGFVFLVFLAAVWYDEAPDADMLRQRESRPQVADENNLFLAMIGADIATDEPLHVAGRRILENPADENVKRLAVSEGNREFIDGVSTECRAITMDGSLPCLHRRLPEKETQAAENRMDERYRALRRYTAFRSGLRSDASFPNIAYILKLQAAFIATHLAVDSADAIPVEELVTDTRFLRDAMAASDTLIARMIAAVALERNYRLLAESIKVGNAQQVAALRTVLAPLPVQALDLSRLAPHEYAAMRMEYALDRQALIRGEDPLQELISIMGMDRPSPFAGPDWQRRIKALWLKPEMTANAQLASIRAQLGISGASSGSTLQRSLDASLNATGVQPTRGRCITTRLIRFVDSCVP